MYASGGCGGCLEEHAEDFEDEAAAEDECEDNYTIIR